MAKGEREACQNGARPAAIAAEAAIPVANKKVSFLLKEGKTGPAKWTTTRYRPMQASSRPLDSNDQLDYPVWNLNSPSRSFPPPSMSNLLIWEASRPPCEAVAVVLPFR